MGLNDIILGFKMILHLRMFVKFFAILCIGLKNPLDKLQNERKFSTKNVDIYAILMI